MKLIAIVVILIASVLVYNFTKGNSCEDKARAAATDTYTIQNTPDTSDRTAKQAQYIQTYMESC